MGYELEYSVQNMHTKASKIALITVYREFDRAAALINTQQQSDDHLEKSGFLLRLYLPFLK